MKTYKPTDWITIKALKILTSQPGLEVWKVTGPNQKLPAFGLQAGTMYNPGYITLI